MRIYVSLEVFLRICKVNSIVYVFVAMHLLLEK